MKANYYGITLNHTDFGIFDVGDSKHTKLEISFPLGEMHKIGHLVFFGLDKLEELQNFLTDTIVEIKRGNR